MLNVTIFFIQVPSLCINGECIPDAHEKYFEDDLDNIVIFLMIHLFINFKLFYFNLVLKFYALRPLYSQVLLL